MVSVWLHSQNKEKLLSFEMWHHVIWQVFTQISEEHTAPTFGIHENGTKSYNIV
jgi:hypothetical protein